MSSDPETSEDQEHSYGSRGAVLFFVGFLVLVVGMWGWTYYMLLDRG